MQHGYTGSKDNKPFVIAIIGGGFCGTILATHLLQISARFSRASGPHPDLPPLQIKLIEKNGPVGPGLAYRASEMCYLLNVPAAKMSAIDGEPDHFLNWLHLQKNRPSASTKESLAQPQLRELLANLQAEPSTFAPRWLYGLYLQDILAQAEATTPAHLACLEKIYGDVVDVSSAISGSGVIIELNQEGQTFQADRVVLALGNLPPRNPPLANCSFYFNSPRYYASPWLPGVLDKLCATDKLLLVGTGLTMVDLVLALKERNYRGEIHAISRHGLLPRPHKTPYTINSVTFAASPTISNPYPLFLDSANLSLTARYLLKTVRQEVKLVVRQGQYQWQDVIDALRPVVSQLWQNLSLAERERFLNHIKPYWEVHRHRMAPQIAATLNELQKSGQLRIHAGRIQSYQEGAAGVKVNFRQRHSGQAEVVVVEQVVNCTGPNSNYQQTENPLIQNLLARGLIKIDPLGLGLETESTGFLLKSAANNGEYAALNPQDKTLPTSFLYSLGTALKGQLWETTAVPELKVQTAQLAKMLWQTIPPELKTS